PVDRVAEMLERRVQRQPRRVDADDLVVRLERGRDHPEDREHHHAEDDEADGVPAGLTRAAGAARRAHAVASPIRTILRTYTTLNAATIRSIRIEIAAPRPKSLLK